MFVHIKNWSSVARVVVGAAIAAVYSRAAMANPQGMTVVTGQATTSQNGSTLNITTSQNTFLDWRSFNIDPTETTRFIQPSAASIVWNRINDPNPSQIFGRIEANGIVVLANQSGFYFGPNSVVKAAGFVATTAGITPEMGAGSAWNFTGLPPLADIVNYGQISVDNGGSLFLIAEKVQNHGILMAPDGTLGLYAGKEVMVSERPDGRGLTAKVVLPEGSVDNRGKLIADGGSIALNAAVVNQDGLIQANSARQVNGSVELIASDSINLGASSQISAAAGDADSSGGTVILKAGNEFRDAEGSKISVAGGDHAGSGGSLEISAPSIPVILSTLDGHAAAGESGGRLFIDPDYLRISSSTSPLPGDPTGTLVVTPSMYNGFSQITLQANRDITLDTTWSLADSSDPASLLRLQAGQNIQIKQSGSIIAGQNWNVELIAGADLGTVNGVIPGAGSITISGSAFISSEQGYIHLYAGKDVLLQPLGPGASVGSGGAVRTLAGGSIDVLALTGNINTGVNSQGYSFTADINNPYLVLAGLGGISTAAGGDVQLIAGGDIASYLPTGNNQSDAGTGAFGKQPGNVNIVAGGKVTGHYVVANGQGTIHAGTDAGTSSSLLALSLVKGSWEVDAGHDITLQQVRNPDGVFNSRSGANFHRFDYDSAASVVLNAANAVTLSGQNTPSGSITDTLRLPSIYPPSLEINAGAGGITLLNDVNLFPSPTGQLVLNTTGGGSLTGVPNNGVNPTFSMSDSGRTQFKSLTDFGPDDHGTVPLHLNDLTPVEINISGDWNGIAVNLAKFGNIFVGGDVINCSFSGANLHDGDVTSFVVAGDIRNRSNLTFYDGATVGPDFSLLARSVFPFSSDPFVYNPATGRITYIGRMTLTDLNNYLNLTVQAVDQFGAPIFDLLGQPVYVHAQFLDPAILEYFYEHTQDVPATAGTGGFTINGTGRLFMSARNVDLGVTAGILSQGPYHNSSLASLNGGKGADIQLITSGNLSMYSSAIASLAGGAIDVNVGGSIDLGSPEFNFSSGSRGIFTTAKADVTVVADGDINIEGSRIAAYDGGNILVRSLNGDVNAGNGGLGVQNVTRITVDPVTGKVVAVSDFIPGSGIIAANFPEASSNPVGNITIETPNGDINGGAGGVVQLSLNGLSSSASSVNLKAGSVLSDGTVIPGNINLSGSGVIGVNIHLDATGNVTGNAVARGDININSLQNVSVSAVGGGSVNVSASGSVGGKIVGIGSANVSGASVSADVLGNVTAGTVTSGQSGFAKAQAAGTTSQSTTAQSDNTKTMAKADTAADDDDEKKKKKNSPTLVKRVNRVTVILPAK